MSAQVIDITTGKRLPPIVELTPEQIVSTKVKQALRGWPPNLIAEALNEGYRRLNWQRTPQDAADGAIAYASRRALQLEPEPPEAA